MYFQSFQKLDRYSFVGLHIVKEVWLTVVGALLFKELEFALVDVPEELVLTSLVPTLIALISADLDALMTYGLLVILSIFSLTVLSAGSVWKSLDELGIKIINVTAIIPIMINLPIKRLFVLGFS